MAGTEYTKKGAASKSRGGVGGGVTSQRLHKITFEDGSVAHLTDTQREQVLAQHQRLKQTAQGHGRSMGFGKGVDSVNSLRNVSSKPQYVK